MTDREDAREAAELAKPLRSRAETVETDETILAGNLPHSDHASDASTSSPQTSLDEEIAFLAPPQQPDEIGRLGGYRVLQVMGVGGMGVVFRAEDPQLKRQVALKAMKPSIAASRSAKQRFLREAQSTAAIEHDNIVHIYQVGEDCGVPFIAMQFLRGESLQGRLERKPDLDSREASRIAHEIASGLAAAHKRGLIHRDIKPDNIWIESESGRAKILDFGLVRSAADIDSGLTQTGMVVGTPRYMSPEQALGQHVDHRCDLFSLGTVLYHMAAGRAPFDGGNVTATLIEVAAADCEPIESLCPDVHPKLAALITKLLQRSPGQRPQSAIEVVEALRDIEHDLAEQAKQRQLPRTAQLPAVTTANEYPVIKTVERPRATPQPKSRQPLIVAGAVGLFALLLLTSVRPQATSGRTGRERSRCRS